MRFLPDLKSVVGDHRNASASLVLFLVGIAVFCSPAAAQDSHYWSEQYGTRSELLGGAVVGSPQDLSTTFYNPGGLASLETESFLLSAQAFEYLQLTIKELSGRFSNLASEDFGVAPSLFAGTFPRHWFAGTLAYSFLSRQRAKIKIDSWSSTTVDSSVTNAFIDVNLSENWGGLTWARRTGKLGLGVTLYGAYRSQRGRFQVLAHPNQTGTAGTAVSTVDDYSYWHTRLLAKAGVYWQLDSASLGITLTTPGLPLFGSGKAAYSRSVVPIGSSMAVAITEGMVPQDISVTYRSPMSIAFGGRYQLGRSALYATLEWFNSVDRYQVLETNVLPQSGPGSTLSEALTQELESVVNVVVGYEYSPREKLTFYGSVLTDFSAAVTGSGAHHAVTTWDIYQLSGGAAFTFAGLDFTLGGSFATGGNELTQQSDVPVTPLLETVDVRYRKVKVFVGFEFGG